MQAVSNSLVLWRAVWHPVRGCANPIESGAQSRRSGEGAVRG